MYQFSHKDYTIDLLGNMSAPQGMDHNYIFIP